MVIVRTLCLLSVLLLAPLAAMAQVIQQLPRIQEIPRSGNNSPRLGGHEVTLETNLLGGYDDNLTPPAGEVLGSYPGGNIGYGDMTLRYFFGPETPGSQRPSFGASVGGFMNTYRNSHVGPSYGGEQRLNGRTRLGRRNELIVSQRLLYAPYFSLGLFRPLQSETNDNNPTTSLRENGSWTTEASASLIHQWTRRTSTDIGYAFIQQIYAGGLRYNSRSHTGNVAIGRRVSSRVIVRGIFRHTDYEFEHVSDGLIPLVTRTPYGEFNYRRGISPSRQLWLWGGFGAGHVRTLTFDTRQPVEYWEPSGYANFRLDVGRIWRVAGEYRRATAVLSGNAPEPFATHAAQFSVGGDVRPWLESVFATEYSNGVSGIQTLGRDPGQYWGYMGTAQLRVRMPAGWSSVISYTHFQYRLNEPARRLLVAPGEFQRNAVRVGVSWLAPLHRAR